MKFYSVALKEFVDKLFQKHIHLWPKLYNQEWQNSLNKNGNFTVTMFLLPQIFIRLSVIYWFQRNSIEKKYKKIDRLTDG